MAGFIIYEGESLYDGKPIVAIATLASGNVKTGNMVQTWILRQDVNPIEASRTGQDSSICGNCPHMGKPSDKATGWAKGRACYVNLLHGPLTIWKAYQRGAYPKVDRTALKTLASGKMVRIGSYGDPACVPLGIWRDLTAECEGWTAYTHAGKNPLPEMLMTSADNLKQAQEAWIRGERTFRIVPDVSGVVKGKEILCPASKEAGFKSTCNACGLCNGSMSKAKSIAIVAHGMGRRHFAA